MAPKKLLTALLLLAFIPLSCAQSDDVFYYKNNESITERTIDFDNKIINIAYSVINDGYPINTKEHFQSAISLGFNSLKTDVQLTKDNKLVLCHDPGFTFNKEGRITTFNSSDYEPIRNLTLSQILRLEIEQGNSKLGYHAHPTTLDCYLSLCSENDIIPYITVRNQHAGETVTAILDLLKYYNIKGKVIINNYPANINTCKLIRRLDSELIICYTTGQDIPLTSKIIRLAKDLGNTIICVHKDNIDKITEDMWNTIRHENIAIFGCDIYSKDDYYRFISLGCQGFQIKNKTVIQ